MTSATGFTHAAALGGRRLSGSAIRCGDEHSS
jgi:hypothetical protein